MKIVIHNPKPLPEVDMGSGVSGNHQRQCGIFIVQAESVIEISLFFLIRLIVLNMSMLCHIL